jgi:hypothetical protein
MADGGRRWRCSAVTSSPVRVPSLWVTVCRRPRVEDLAFGAACAKVFAFGAEVVAGSSARGSRPLSVAGGVGGAPSPCSGLDAGRVRGVGAPPQRPSQRSRSFGPVGSRSACSTRVGAGPGRDQLLCVKRNRCRAV